MNALNGLDRLRAKPPLLRTAAMKTGLPTLMKSPLFLTWPGSWGLRPLRYQRALPVCVQFPNFDTIPSEEGIIHSITYWNIRLLIIIYLSKQQPLFGRTAGILNVDIFEKLRVLRKGKEQALSHGQQGRGFGPSNSSRRQEKLGLPCYGEPLPSLHPTGSRASALDRVESSGCFHSEEERKWGSGWQDHLSFGLIVFLRCQNVFFPLWSQNT